MARRKNSEIESVVAPGGSKVYLKNKDLYEEILKSKLADKLTPTAEIMFQLLVKKFSNKLPYKNPEDKKDCMSSAHLDLLRYWRSFNPDKSKNAFAYYTEIAKKGFAKGWNILHPKKYAGTMSLNGNGFREESDGIYTV